MSIQVHCGIRPSDRLIERLVLIEGHAGSALAEAMHIPLYCDIDAIEDTVAALKVAFVSDVIQFSTDATERLAIFGQLEPAVEQFDSWWFCDVYLTTLSMKSIIGSLTGTRQQPQVDAGIAKMRREVP